MNRRSLGRVASTLVAVVMAVGLARAGTDPLGDQARTAGKPLIVDFGMTRCLQCIQQSKTMDRLKETFGESVLLQFVHIGEQEAMASVYKVMLIPTLVYFDAQGQEVFRNVGQMEHDEMVTKARALGMIP